MVTATNVSGGDLDVPSTQVVHFPAGVPVEVSDADGEILAASRSFEVAGLAAAVSVPPDIPPESPAPAAAQPAPVADPGPAPAPAAPAATNP